MESNERVICRANFWAGITPLAVVFTVLWWIIGGVGYYVTGPWLSEGSDDGEHIEEYMWGIRWHYHDEFHSYYGIETTDEDYPMLHALGIAITVIVFVLPVVIFLIRMFIAKRCKLELTEGQIEGQLKTTFGKKKLQIPIDHLDNVMTSSGFWDKIRGGETLLISSNSGLIKFHYVRNADEFAQAAMTRIEEVKKAAPAQQPISAQPPASAPSVSGSEAMEKLNSLKQMLDSGLITQEQFEQKKADILDKM